jgi:hypothetical protein
MGCRDLGPPVWHVRIVPSAEIEALLNTAAHPVPVGNLIRLVREAESRNASAS